MTHREEGNIPTKLKYVWDSSSTIRFMVVMDSMLTVFLAVTGYFVVMQSQPYSVYSVVINMLLCVLLVINLLVGYVSGREFERNEGQ